MQEDSFRLVTDVCSDTGLRGDQWSFTEGFSSQPQTSFTVEFNQKYRELILSHSTLIPTVEK